MAERDTNCEFYDRTQFGEALTHLFVVRLETVTVLTIHHLLAHPPPTHGI